MEDLVAWKKKDDFQARRLSIIDFSSEDDSLLGSAPEFLQDDASSESHGRRSMDLFGPVDDNKLEEIFEPVDANKLQEIPETDELVPQPSECLEPEMIRKNGKYNLRKSLAWDSAFFTCEGVLDAEELSSMISVDKSQKRMLPGIQEEVHRSTDSMSTLGSDTLTLESVDSLFEDVRASIQRSRKPVKMAVGSSKVVSAAREAKLGGGVKKMELVSQLKPKVVAKKPSINIQNPGKLPRPVRACPQLPQPVAVAGETTLSDPQRPKVLDKLIPSSTRMAKRASFGGDLLRVEKDNSKTAAGRGTPVPKLPGSVRNVPRPSKSSSVASSSAATTGPTSSIDSTGSTSSVKSGKSPSNSLKRTALRSGNPTNSLKSNPKTPSRVTSGDNMESGKTRLSSQFMPSPKLSSSISPASSVSEWSSESVSSISSSHQIPCSSRDSLSKSYSSKKVPMDLDTAECVNYDEQNSARSASRVSRLPGQGTPKATTGLFALPPTSKPSGLRLPSPKIGFFDGVKSAVRTPKRNIQSNPAASSNSKAAGARSVSPRGSGTKSKLGKVNPEKSAAIGSKPDAMPSFSNVKPKLSPSQKASKTAMTDVSSDSRKIESYLTTPPIVETNSPLKVDQEEVGNSECDIGLGNKDIGFSENMTTDVLKAEVILETKSSGHKEDEKITCVSGDHISLSDSGSISDVGNLVCSKENAKGVHHEAVEFKNGELKSEPEDQIVCLMSHVGAMEITGVEGMLIGDALASHQKLDGDNICDSPNGLSKPDVHVSPTTSDDSNSNSKRIPFSAKDSLCNIGGSLDFSKGSMPSEGEKNSQLQPFSEEHFDREQLR